MMVSMSVGSAAIRPPGRLLVPPGTQRNSGADAMDFAVHPRHRLRYPASMRLSVSQVAAVAFVLGMAVQVAVADQPMEQDLQVLNPTEEQQIEGGAVAGAEQEVRGLDGGAAQEVGEAGVRTASQKRASTAAKFGVAVVGGA